MSPSAWPPTSPFPPSNIAYCRQLDSRIRLRYFSSLPSCSSSTHSTDEWRYMHSLYTSPPPSSPPSPSTPPNQPSSSHLGNRYRVSGLLFGSQSVPVIPVALLNPASYNSDSTTCSCARKQQ